MLRQLLGLFRKHEVVETVWAKRIAAALTEAGLPARTEVPLADKTRVDIQTDYLAVEVDWAPKWAECVGQALYYALRTSRKPVALLLIEDARKDAAELNRVKLVAKNNTPRLAVWTFDVKTRVLDMDGTKIQVK